MNPRLLHTRQILTTTLTVIGVGLFIAVSIRAIHQVADRRYTEGKQRAVPSSVSLPLATVENAAANTARYETNVARLADSTSTSPSPTTLSASPSTPPTESDNSSEPKVATANQAAHQSNGSNGRHLGNANNQNVD